jgi:hypothetical protein
MKSRLRPRLLWFLLGLAGLLVLAWPAWRNYTERQIRAELDSAEREMKSGFYAKARRRLASLATRYPGRGEVEYQLGLCEAGYDHIDAALAAWSRVPAGSPFSGRALLLRALEAQNAGRYGPAEDLYRSSLKERGPHEREAWLSLLSLLKTESRIAEARRLLQDEWVRGVDSVDTIRELWRLDVDPFPIEGVKSVLEKAGRSDPKDDRVWMGRAYVAIRQAQFDDANRWLTACERSRARDLAVALARAEWAQAAGRTDDLARALADVPTDSAEAGEVAATRAWLAARRGDRDAERTALEAVLKERPGDTRALERLAELAIADGHAKQATLLRAKKAELDRTRVEYEDLLNENDPVTHAERLAQLAEFLGRPFDAHVWWTLRDQSGSEHAAARAAVPRLTEKSPAAGQRRTTLADLLARDLEATRDASRPSSRRALPPELRDDAPSAGLAFTYDNGRSPERQLPETMSGGVALIDFDNDGWLDVYVVQGGRFPPGSESGLTRDRLFRNRGDGTFEDATAHAALSGLPGGYGHGVTVGDYDNDGAPDLFITRWRSYMLLHNNGDGTFEDRTAAVGLGGDRDWPTSAAFGDLDGDGDLDLYVCHYLRWDSAHPRVCASETTHENYYCNPHLFEALPDHVFQNDGDRFTDVTEHAGIVDRDGRGLGVVITDLDGDGQADIFVANDMSANFLFRNLGGFRFEEVAYTAGVACNADGGYQAGMGIACGDLDGDGLTDLAVTNFYGQSTTLFHNMGHGLFVDHTKACGLAAPSQFLLGFGAAFVDVNDDGFLDLLTANGHVNDGRPTFPWMMPAQLLLGGPDGRLSEFTPPTGSPLTVPHLGRGLAVGDIDNDGRADALLLSQNETLVYLHNATQAGHQIDFLLRGTQSNRDGIGATITVRAGGHTRVHPRFGGGSYQSASDLRLHVGLGSSSRVEEVSVRWPSGHVDRYHDLVADNGYSLREGSPIAVPHAISR